jgi:hypothetical protein
MQRTLAWGEEFKRRRTAIKGRWNNSKGAIAKAADVSESTVTTYERGWVHDRADSGTHLPTTLIRETVISLAQAVGWNIYEALVKAGLDVTGVPLDGSEFPVEDWNRLSSKEQDFVVLHMRFLADPGARLRDLVSTTIDEAAVED